jgi:hypothetical protein
MMVNSDGVESPATILDISSGGFRLEVSETPRIGEHVTLRVERGEQFRRRSAGRSAMRPGVFSLRQSIGTSGPDRVGFLAMADQDTGSEDRRQNPERRDGEDRRSGIKRRQGGRTDDRREGERREGERRAD